MAYNYYGYQPYMPNVYGNQMNQQMNQQVNQPVKRPDDGFIWVQGESAAKSFMVAPNTTVTLWDSEAQVIYIKSADASGMPSMRIIDYTFRDTPTNQAFPGNNEFATKNDLEAVEKRLNERLDEIMKGDK